MEPCDALCQAMPALLARGALDVALRQRAKFEGWLKVELGAALAARGLSTRLEQEYVARDGARYRADVAILSPHGRHLVMLKTVNTNFRFGGVESCTRPITRNVAGVIEDVRKLQGIPDADRGYVLFAVFPVCAQAPARREQLRMHLDRITAVPADPVAEGFVPKGADAWGVSWYLLEVRRDGQGAA